MGSIQAERPEGIKGKAAERAACILLLCWGVRLLPGPREQRWLELQLRHMRALTADAIRLRALLRGDRCAAKSSRTGQDLQRWGAWRLDGCFVAARVSGDDEARWEGYAALGENDTRPHARRRRVLDAVHTYSSAGPRAALVAMAWSTLEGTLEK
ncbi:hypothetical protein GQ53DRAFT_858865 [Thozetella sp. PMI_491]|nr:hypothetical protein GQ53DRAFT_858865 [Thozetella sp. PMI_491]